MDYEDLVPPEPGDEGSNSTPSNGGSNSQPNEPKPDLRTWDPEAALASAEEESKIFDKTLPQLAQTKIEESVTAAVDSMRWLALFSNNDNTRFRAAAYLIDRAFGPMKAGDGGVTTKDPLEEMMAKLEATANEA